MKAYVFPGQGAQFPGMGKDLFESLSSSKKLFELSNDILGFNISEIMFDGTEQDLKQTRVTQPAIFLISYSIFQVIKKEFNIDLNKANYFAGHSLGEYSALSCAGYLNFSDTLKLLRLRGDAMKNAVPK